DPETLLLSIVYTGQGAADQGHCSTGADARAVEFAYTDRDDNRTTYSFGVAVPMTQRLAAILTRVGNQYVRRYELSYSASTATNRSLLTGVTLCAGATCGVEKLPTSTFTYQQDAPSFDFWQVQSPYLNGGQPLGPDWWARVAPDFDGDGTRDHFY